MMMFYSMLKLSRDLFKIFRTPNQFTAVYTMLPCHLEEILKKNGNLSFFKFFELLRHFELLKLSDLLRIFELLRLVKLLRLSLMQFNKNLTIFIISFIYELLDPKNIGAQRI